MNVLLEVRDISKRFPRAARAALHRVSFEVRDGELLTLVGASGSGKTSLLRILAGLETADEGEIRQGGVVLTRGSRILVPPERRHMGFVFQNHALFPHLKVRDNVAFGLGRDSNRRQRITDLLELVGLNELADRYPHELSGGERQRIALVRALAPNPRLVLMDEPFSSLDQSLRQELRDETRRLLEQQRATTILVTHDADDALAVSDRILVLREGVVQQVGTPAEIYRRPANRYIASSFGPCNFLSRTTFPIPSRLGACRNIEPAERSADEIWIRPEDLALSAADDTRALTSGVVTQSLYHGESRLITLQCRSPGGQPFSVQVRQHGEVGAAAGERFHVVPSASETRDERENSGRGWHVVQSPSHGPG